MEVRVLTLRYSPTLGAIDDTPLCALSRDREVLGVREHFFVVHDVPHLLCVVSCQPRPVQAATVAQAANPAQAPLPAEAPVPDPAPRRTNTRPGHDLSPAQRRLFDTIRAWRAEAAREHGVPPYVVLTNRNLDDLVRERPQTPTALAGIRGIGKAKVGRYGDALLGLLRDVPCNRPPERAGGAPGPTASDEESTTPSVSRRSDLPDPAPPDAALAVDEPLDAVTDDASFRAAHA